MFLARDSSNHNFPNFCDHRVSKCMANIYGGSARNINNQNYLAVQYFSANDILLRLCKAKMKIYKRSLQGLLSSTLTALLLALTCVLLQLTSLAIRGEF